ncbi:NAD(P)-binding protein [Trichoderma velutinum]
MVSFNTVLAHNEALKGRPEGLTALFVGATRGIGLATLRCITVKLKAPKLYVVGRSKTQFAPIFLELRATNPAASITFIESDISLIRNADSVAEQLSTHESHLDLLYLSPGYLAFGGPYYTDEGLDTCFVLSHYVRTRIISQLLPLLNAARRPRVLSILAGGHESSLFTKDGDLGLTLDNARNYNPIRAADQLTTFHTIVLNHLASHNPHVSFLHIHPGWVATNFASNILSSAGIVGALLKPCLLPIFNLLATDEAHSAERQVFHAFSRRYQSRDLLRSGEFDADDVASCHVPYNGFYRVLGDGQTVSGGRFLQSLEAEGWADEAIQFTEKIIAQALTRQGATHHLD